MAGLPSLDLDNLEPGGLLDLAAEVKEAWSERDEAIRRATELRKQAWSVEVPPNWVQTAKQSHSSLSKEIPARVAGTLALRDPQFSRAAPSDDVAEAEKATAVERYFQGRHQHDKRTAVPGKNAWLFTLDQLISKGAVCCGSTYAPHAWAGAPLFMDGDAIRAVHWRDTTGRVTQDAGAMDVEASTRAFERSVDLHRATSTPPVSRRVLLTEQCFPLFVEGRLLALFVERDSSLLDVRAGGFLIDGLATSDKATNRKKLLEVHTANRARYFYDGTALAHEGWGKEGIVTNYGFVPYTYRVGLEGGDLDYGSYGTPLLGLIESNLRLIDTLLTYQLNAIHLASFTSFYIEYTVNEDGSGVASVVEKESGRKVTTYDFKSGTIMDFGPNRRVVPLEHPGLNRDFDKFLEFQISEVNRIIPRTLQGQAESSGYNTAQTSIQAKAIFNPIADAAELLCEDLAVMEMRHICERVPGPIYLDVDAERLPGSSQKRKLARVKIDKDDIGPYYGIRATIDREIDRITYGTFGANMKAAGIFDEEEAYDLAGGTDFERHKARQQRDKILDMPEVQQALAAKAAQRFGLEDVLKQAAAQGKIGVGPDGVTPVVNLPDGGQAGPGVGRLPSAQGAVGGAAPNVGQPNLASTHNPSIALPAPTDTGRGRLRRRGGAIPGAPQRQDMTRPGAQPV
jgi:hypothetical protein